MSIFVSGLMKLGPENLYLNTILQLTLYHALIFTTQLNTINLFIILSLSLSLSLSLLATNQTHDPFFFSIFSHR